MEWKDKFSRLCDQFFDAIRAIVIRKLLNLNFSCPFSYSNFTKNPVLLDPFTNLLIYMKIF